jgi:hypothetical protein
MIYFHNISSDTEAHAVHLQNISKTLIMKLEADAPSARGGENMGVQPISSLLKRNSR